ncbi:hypothetical protein U1Q18_010648 [Sarracenia purpurea var. burkii]
MTLHSFLLSLFYPECKNQIDEEALIASTGWVMENPSQNQNQNQNNQQGFLKCPRCDSSNTKFCYYNNYSLSQPRHFCKACKRYWTRGGNLRNVPVGGASRKNKRFKRPAASAIDAPPPSSSSTPPPTLSNPTVLLQSQIDVSSTSNHINPLFYGLPTNLSVSDLNDVPYPRFNPRVQSQTLDTVSGFDLQPQFHTLGLGFSSGLTRNSLLSSDSIFGCSFSSSSSSFSPTMASLLASSFQQQKVLSLKDIQEGNSFQGLIPYEDLSMAGSNEAGMATKEVMKLEGGQKRFDWSQKYQNQQISPFDHPSLYWNATSAGSWFDPANLGSSVPSLI